ncbi:MAG: family acetyltransferase [Rhodospirillales bacterium]|jgi:GNAT superfamily N-acetyltransferase|nr:family acetyltransferase [Rhodospirillales bacterium]
MQPLTVPAWSRDVELDSNHVVQLRRIRPQDASALQRAFAALPAEDVHEALYEMLRALPAATAAQLAANDRARAVTVIATEPARDVIIGFARTVPIDHTSGEAGDVLLLVAHPWRSIGLEAALLRELAIEADAIGYCRLQASMLAQDGYHAEIYRQLGWQIHADPDDPRLRIAAREIG